MSKHVVQRTKQSPRFPCPPPSPIAMSVKLMREGSLVTRIGDQKQYCLKTTFINNTDSFGYESQLEGSNIEELLFHRVRPVRRITRLKPTHRQTAQIAIEAAQLHHQRALLLSDQTNMAEFDRPSKQSLRATVQYATIGSIVFLFAAITWIGVISPSIRHTLTDDLAFYDQSAMSELSVPLSSDQAVATQSKLTTSVDLNKIPSAALVSVRNPSILAPTASSISDVNVDGAELSPFLPNAIDEDLLPLVQKNQTGIISQPPESLANILVEEKASDTN